MMLAFDIIKAMMIIGLSIGTFLFNYNKSDILFKVNILPITTIILSIIFGYQAYSTHDYMILQIWICIFLFSISILYAYKMNIKNLELNNINSMSNTNSVMNNQLDEIKMNKIYAFFKLNELLTNDLNFQQFKEAFLKTPIYLNMDVPTLREFFNFLKIQKGIYIKNINDDFLQYFINSKTKEYYKYNQFISEAKPNSKYSLEIKKLFNHF